MGMNQGLVCDLKGIVRSAEVPTAAVYMRPHQEGSVIQEKVLKKLTVGLCVGVDFLELHLRQWAAEDYSTW